MSELYAAQITIEERFQEPQTFEKWAAGDRITNPVDLGNIDRVPVSLVVPVADEICSPDMAEWHYTQIQSEQKYIRFEHGGHSIFSYQNSADLMNRLVETIEFGTSSASSLFTFMTAVWLILY